MKLVIAPRSFAPPEPVAPSTKNLVPWIPYLWRQILFPGRADADVAARPGSFAFLVVAAAILVLPRLDFHLFEPDEGRYAQIPKEMLARGDWLVPVLRGEPYLDKPPLFYWFVMLAYGAFGEAAWVARLVPVLAVVGCAASVYLLGRRAVGERSAFWGALLLTLAPGLTSMGRILVLDGLLTLFTTLGLLAAFEAIRGRMFASRWWTLACLALALGTLTKGPIALILVVPPIVAYGWLMRPRFGVGGSADVPAAIPRGAWAAMLAIVLLVNLPWYAAVSIRQPEFASHFLWKHNLQRFLTPFDHEEPFWYFLPVAFLGLAPAVVLLWPMGRFLLAERANPRRGPEMGFFLIAGLWCVGFFSLSGSKLPTYILPAFPPLCLALGSFVRAAEWDANRWFRGWLAAWSVALALGHWIGVPLAAWHRSPMNHPAEARPYLEDRSTPIYCYPRPVDSVGFYLDRDDFQVYRSKELAAMLQSMDKHRRSVVLFAHRNSKLILTHNLPPHFRVVYVGKLGLCDMAVIER